MAPTESLRIEYVINQKFQYDFFLNLNVKFLISKWFLTIREEMGLIIDITNGCRAVGREAEGNQEDIWIKGTGFSLSFY